MFGDMDSDDTEEEEAEIIQFVLTAVFHNRRAFLF